MLAAKIEGRNYLAINSCGQASKRLVGRRSVYISLPIWGERRSSKSHERKKSLLSNRKEITTRGSDVKDYLTRLGDCLNVLDVAAIEKAVGWIAKAGSDGRFVFTCGNGGSSCIASHFVGDLMKGAAQSTGIPFKAVCLSDNTPTLMAVANDEDYEHVFVRPLMSLASRDDVLVAISASGNSPNVLRAVEYAQGIGCRTIGLTTGRGGKLLEAADLALAVDTDHVGRLEDAFLTLCHVMAFSIIDGGS